MGKIRISVLIILIVTLSVAVFGQERDRVVFPPEPNGYLAAAETFLQPLPSKEKSELIDNFKSWISTYQPEENEWIELAQTTNKLISFGFNPHPDYTGFLKTCISFSSGSLNRQAFYSLMIHLRNHLDKDPSIVYVSKTLQFVRGFNDDSELYSSGSVNWLLKSSDCHLIADTTLVLTFSTGVLTGIAGREEATIQCDKGKYYPAENLLFIESGKTTWTSVDLHPEEVYAFIPSCHLDLSRSVYTIDSVVFHDKRYFEDPIIGKLENKIATGLPKDRRGYPKFSSYDIRNSMKDLFKDIDYTGGYSLQGQKIVGANLNNNQGTLTVFLEGNPALRIASDYFVFTKQTAKGLNAEVSIYIDQDSVFHPGLSFQYQDKDRTLNLIRDGQGLSNSRFFNSYHELDLDVEMMTLTLPDSKIVLSGRFGSLNNRAEFESSDFYSIDRFNEIQVADPVNPLIILKRCSQHYHSRYFTTADLSAFMDRPFHLVEGMLLDLSFLGFVRYNTDEQLVEVLQRTFDFIDKHAQAQDYDIIRFRSSVNPPQPNGFLDLLSGRLDLFGVERIELSLKREVTAYPAEQKVSILKNRNIRFDGYLRSGLGTFTGSGFSLNYDPFEIGMDHIDFVRLSVHVPKKDFPSETEIKEVTSIIENTAGKIIIDHPQNKSGIAYEDLPEYPLFVADTGAFVYYDQAFIQGGAYQRDSFYFVTENLKISGLNSKTLKDSLTIQGQLITAGIFPEISVTLGYQSDHSLGFDTLFTPDEGYSVYHGKGTFYNQIIMNSEGLLGNGMLEYLGASLASDHFLFLPDQVITRSAQIDVAENTVGEGSPAAAGSDVNIVWSPDENILTANQPEGLLSLYPGVSFEGDVYLEPDGLKGKGVLKTEGYKVNSDLFNFFQNSFVAEDADLNLFSKMQTGNDEAVFAEISDFEAHHASVNVDFSENLMKIYPKGEKSYARFPENQFEAIFTEIIWQPGSDQIQISSPQLTSVHPTQQSLSFKGGSADYDRNNYLLLSRGVDYLDIADVRIFPANNEIRVRKDAFIDPVPASSIVARDTSIHHRISEGTVTITSSADYRAEGYYKYRDRADREFSIFMDDIRVSKNITVASGAISPDDKFYLSPEYAFQGTTSLSMNKNGLRFDGHYMLTHDCAATTKKWISVQSDIDPLNILLPFDSVSTDINGDKAYAGFFLSNQPVEFYATFLGPHVRYSDHPLIEVDGLVTFDDVTGDYVLASSEKLANPEMAEPEIRFDRQNCEISAEGSFSNGIDLGSILLELSGKAIHDLQTDSVSLQTMAGLDFFMNEKSMDYMAKELNAYNKAQAVNYADQQFRRALQFYLGPERAIEILNELSLRGSFRRLPEEFKHSILFSHLNLKWNPERGSFQSTGKIGISNILDNPVNKMFDGHLEITHRRGGGSLTLYIETEPGSYFYFYYSRGLMQVLAGPKFEKFNDYVRDTKEAKRKAETNSEVAYQYYLGQYRLVRNFLDEMNVNGR